MASPPSKVSKAKAKKPGIIQRFQEKQKNKHMKLRDDQEALSQQKGRTGINKNYIVGQSPLRSIEVEQKLIEVSIIPIPRLDTFWKVTSIFMDKSKKKRMGVRGEISENKLATLRDEASKTPGSVRMEVQKLLKSYPRKRELYMLSGVCTNKMLQHTKGNLGQVVEGLKLAVHDAATALVSDGITLYNLRNFFDIYFTFLEKLQRVQKRAYDDVKNDMSYGNLRMNLIYAMAITDLLLEKKKSSNDLLAYLGDKFKKSSMAGTHFDFISIKKAMDYINGGMPNKKIGELQADTLIDYVTGILNNLTKIPILEPLVINLLGQIGGSKLTIRLKKSAIVSSKLFFDFKIAMAMREIEPMKKLGKRIYSINLNTIKLVKRRTIKHYSEFDPFMNLGLITEFSVNLYPKKDQAKMLSSTMKVLERVALLDTTEDRKYSNLAGELMDRLDGFINQTEGLRIDDKTDPLEEEKKPEQTNA